MSTLHFKKHLTRSLVAKRRLNPAIANRSDQGLTLIEALIAIVIISITHG